MSLAALEARLRVRLPDDLRAFWSEPDLGALAPGGVFAEPLSPAAVLDVDLAALPVDFLPIAGDGTGSYLCARLGPHGDVLEYVFWAHDDWSDALPFGRTLAEVLLLAAATSGDDDRAAAAPALRWALAHAERQLAAAIERGVTAGQPLDEVLLARGVGLESLGTPGHEVRGSRYEIHDPRFQRYYRVEEALAGVDPWYDLDALPAAVRAALDKDYGGLSEPAWEVMDDASARVIALRDDIGWAWILRADLAGYRDEHDVARVAITHAARCLQRTFTIHDQSLLHGVRGLADATDPLVAAFLARDAAAIAAHWADMAARATDAGDDAAAWNAWYRHVHHAPQPHVHDLDVREGYARAAAQGGFTCWAALIAARS
ncbi:MAG: SMI1/KNR4 family protein [Deltaproteobacteria bacterium]|nr:SMI1/KNR4 family protein [Deltaproteobacteria bacterium]